MLPRPHGLIVSLLSNWTELLQFSCVPDHRIGRVKRRDILSLLKEVVVVAVLQRSHRLIVVFQEQSDPSSTYSLAIHHGS